MDEKHDAGPHHVAHEGHVDELEQLKALWDAHGLKLVIGLCVLAVVIGSVRFYRGRVRRQARGAVEQLEAARTPEDLQAVIDGYGGTTAAPLALLRLAKVYYDTGSYDQAMASYDDFLDRYAEHPLAAVADVGKANALEARGQLKAAEQAFGTFVRERPMHYLTPQAVMGQARCLEQQGSFEQARVIYEDFIAASGEGPWADRVRQTLEDMDKRMKQPAATPAAMSVPVLDFGQATTVSAADTPTVTAAPIVAVPLEDDGGE